MTEPSKPPRSSLFPSKRSRRVLAIAMLASGAAGLGIAALLVNIFQHKQEAKNPYLRFVAVTQETTDPEAWRPNWQRQYDGYRRTVEATKTNFGGGDVNPVQ